MEIRKYLYDNGMKATVEKFGLSPYKIRKLVGGWTKQDKADFLLRQAHLHKEERKLRRWNKETLRRSQPHIKQRIAFSSKKFRASRVFKHLAHQANNSRHKPVDKITAQELFSIAKQQRLICPYTGVKLTRDIISVEHTIPQSKGGRNIKENIRLTHIWANRMKLDYSLDEFKEMIALLHSTLC